MDNPWYAIAQESDFGLVELTTSRGYVYRFWRQRIGWTPLSRHNLGPI